MITNGSRPYFKHTNFIVYGLRINSAWIIYSLQLPITRPANVILTYFTCQSCHSLVKKIHAETDLQVLSILQSDILTCFRHFAFTILKMRTGSQFNFKLVSLFLVMELYSLFEMGK